MSDLCKPWGAFKEGELVHAWKRYPDAYDTQGIVFDKLRLLTQTEIDQIMEVNDVETIRNALEFVQKKRGKIPPQDFGPIYEALTALSNIEKALQKAANILEPYARGNE